MLKIALLAIGFIIYIGYGLKSNANSHSFSCESNDNWKPWFIDTDLFICSYWISLVCWFLSRFTAIFWWSIFILFFRKKLHVWSCLSMTYYPACLTYSFPHSFWYQDHLTAWTLMICGSIRIMQEAIIV